jgi:hypothetical protein
MISTARQTEQVDNAPTSEQCHEGPPLVLTDPASHGFPTLVLYTSACRASLAESVRDDLRMTERKKIGRPSKGDRVVTWTRLPRAHRETAEALAAELGQPLSEVLAALVAIGFNHRSELVLPAARSNLQEELPLDRAS